MDLINGFGRASPGSWFGSANRARSSSGVATIIAKIFEHNDFHNHIIKQEFLSTLIHDKYSRFLLSNY